MRNRQLLLGKAYPPQASHSRIRDQAMSTHCLEEAVPGTKISHEGVEDSNRAKKRPGTKSYNGMEKEGGAKRTKRKSKGRVLLPSLATRNAIQDIVLAA